MLAGIVGLPPSSVVSPSAPALTPHEPDLGRVISRGFRQNQPLATAAAWRTDYSSPRSSTGGISGACRRRQTILAAAMTGTDKNIPATPPISPPASTPKITSAGWI